MWMWYVTHRLGSVFVLARRVALTRVSNFIVVDIYLSSMVVSEKQVIYSLAAWLELSSVCSS